MLDLHAFDFTISIDQSKPILHSFEQFDRLSELLEILSSELDACLLRLVEHQLHIAEDIARVLVESDLITFLPELLGLLSDGLDESELLHVSRRECAVKVVDQGYNWSIFHRMNQFL